MAHLHGWSSAEKPSVVQSPALSSAEIRGRLNFSSVKTPPAAVRRLPPNDINTMSNVGNRLGDYHMSKQNPAVIDQLYSPRDHKNDLYKTASPLFNGLNHSNGSRSGRTQIQTFLRQTLNRRNSLPGSTGTSLVHLALQGRQRRYDSVPVSPVIVRLSGSGLSGSKGAELGKLNEEETAVNPCDKDVVVSALRQKRKRWPTSYDDNSPASDIFPSAKRTRHSTHPQDGPAPPSHVSLSKQLPERKRANQTLAACQPLKRTKVARPSSTVTSSTSSTHKENLFNRLRVPDIEYESGSETASDVGPDASEPQSTENGDTESVTSGRSSTPILQEEDEDTEMKKKREESLKLQRSLTTVFPPSLSRKSSSRRKLPVFCATGSKPHLPVPLSLTHSATPEDLKRDREAAAAKLKDFLSDEDEESKKKEKAESQTPVSSSQPSVTATSVTTAVLPTLATTSGLPPPPTSSASLSAVTQIPSALQLGKDVQPAPISAAGQSTASSLPATATSLQSDKTSLPGAKPSSQLTSSSSLTSLTPATTSAGRDAPIMSTSQTGLLSRLPGLTGSLPSLQFKPSAPKSVSFLLPASTSSTSVLGSGVALTQSQPGVSDSKPQPTGGGLQFSGTGLNISARLAAPVLSSSSASGSSTTATKTTAANSLPTTFNFPASLQSSTPTLLASSTASLVPQQPRVQQALGPMLGGGAQLPPTSRNDAGSSGGLFPKTAALATTEAPRFNLSSIAQQPAGSIFSQNKPTLVSSTANQFPSLQMPTSSAGSVFPSSSTASTGTTFSFNLSNNPFNASSSSAQGAKGLNIASNQPQQGSIFGQNVAPGGSSSNPGGLLQGAAASAPSGGLNFNLSAGNPQGGTFNFSAGAGTGTKPALGGLQMPQTQQAQQQQSMMSLGGGAGAGNQSGFNFSAGLKQNPLGGQLQSAAGSGSIFGSALASSGVQAPFSFSANQQGSAKPSVFSGGRNGSQPATAASQPSLSFSAGLNLQNQQQPQPGVFNAGPKQQSVFNFSAGMNSGQGQQQNQGFNFMAGSGSAPGQNQNQNQTNAFSFSATAGGLGQQLQNTGAGVFGTNSQPSKLFGTGSGNQTQNQGTGVGMGFPTPSQQAGFNFSASLGNQQQQQQQQQTPSFNFSAGTPQGGLGPNPSAFNFSAGTPGTTPGRVVAKPRRRNKK